MIFLSVLCIIDLFNRQLVLIVSQLNILFIFKAYLCAWVWLRTLASDEYKCVANKILEIFGNQAIPLYANYEEKLHNALDAVLNNGEGTFYEFVSVSSFHNFLK